MQYPALKKFVIDNGGPRVAFRRDAAMRLVDAIVEEWPGACEPAHIAEVVQAKMAVRTRKKYGGILAAFIISVLVNHIVRLVIEWWLKRPSHKVLMEGWSRRAKEAQDLPPA